MNDRKDSASPTDYDREIQPRRPTRAELDDGSATAMPPSSLAPALAWVTVGDLEELQEGDPLPRRGYAVRPDVSGAQILYDDAKPLGRAVRVELFKDLRVPGAVEETRVQYEPKAPA